MIDVLYIKALMLLIFILIIFSVGNFIGYSRGYKRRNLELDSRIDQFQSGKKIYTLLDIEERLEDCNCYVEMETYYLIKNNITGVTKWVNKRFAKDYNL